MNRLMKRGDGPAESRIAEINRALARWKDAVRYFETVSDPELVDFAIYEMEAARRKYMFLLKQERAGG